MTRADPIRAALERLLYDIQDLSDSSQGIVGLHRNGDPAPWNELLEGGRYSSWLGDAIAAARAALAEQQGKGPSDIPPGPFSEHELREQWNQQADEFNQWDSLDSCEQLAWAQARAIQRDRNARPTPPAEGEVAELAAKLRRLAPHNPLGTADPTITRAAELLQQQHPTPVPVSERLPAMVTDGLRVAGDCDEQGRCWAGTRAFVDTSGDRDIDYPPSWELREVRAQDDVWLPAHALPLPQGEAQQ